MKQLYTINAFLWLPFLVAVDLLFWNLLFGSEYGYKGLSEVAGDHVRQILIDGAPELFAASIGAFIFCASIVLLVSN